MVPLPTGSTAPISLPDGQLPPGFIPIGAPTSYTASGVHPPQSSAGVGSSGRVPFPYTGNTGPSTPGPGRGTSIPGSGRMASTPGPGRTTSTPSEYLNIHERDDQPVVIPPPSLSDDDDDESSSDTDTLTTRPRYRAAGSAASLYTGATGAGRYNAAGGAVTGTPYMSARSPSVAGGGESNSRNLYMNAGMTPGGFGRGMSFGTEQGASVRG